MLQQYLPFTVLKLIITPNTTRAAKVVATVPTVYGIETFISITFVLYFDKVATVPTVYGIETICKV